MFHISPCKRIDLAALNKNLLYGFTSLCQEPREPVANFDKFKSSTPLIFTIGALRLTVETVFNTGKYRPV
jgi:hypothetical protein